MFGQFPSDRVVEARHKVASSLLRDFDAMSTDVPQLYTNLEVAGFKPELTRDGVGGLLGVMGLYVESNNPIGRKRELNRMARSLADCAMHVDDIVTAYYAAEHMDRYVLGDRTSSMQIVGDVYRTWDKWVETITQTAQS